MYFQARVRAFTRENILSAFKATGVLPFNPDRINPAVFGLSQILHRPNEPESNEPESNESESNEPIATIPLDPLLLGNSTPRSDIESAVRNPQKFKKSQLATFVKNLSQQVDSLAAQNYLEDQHNKNLYSQLRRVTAKKKNRRSLPFARV
jgi:hypothetical protein